MIRQMICLVGLGAFLVFAGPSFGQEKTRVPDGDRTGTMRQVQDRARVQEQSMHSEKEQLRNRERQLSRQRERNRNQEMTRTNERERLKQDTGSGFNSGASLFMGSRAGTMQRTRHQAGSRRGR